MNKNKKTEVYWHEHKIDRDKREDLLRQKSFLLWFTGLPSSGKSTIGSALEYELHNMGYLTYIMDGDNVRHGLNSDLGFSDVDRKENIRRIAHVSSLFVDAGLIVISAFISPFIKDRLFAQSQVDKGRFIEVFIDCNLEECIKRDPKGLYKKALNKEIFDFTGISSPYEKPYNPEIVLKTDILTIEESVKSIIYYLKKNKYLNSKI